MNNYDHDPIETLLAAVQATRPKTPHAPYGFATSTVATFLEQKRKRVQDNRMLFRILGFAFSVCCLCFVLPQSQDDTTTSSSYLSPDTWVQQGDPMEQYYDQIARN